MPHFEALPVEAPAAGSATAERRFLSARQAWILLTLVWLAVHFAALFLPPLLDDADATHADAAQHMALTGDWVTLKVDGVRYLEKPPLPYWLAAVDYHIFGFDAFATHLPMALGVLAMAWLAWVWGRRAWDDRAGFYAALAVLTTIGIFLFTRIFIPEVLLTFLISLALYCFLTGLEDGKPNRHYVAWAALALAMLAKGLIAPVFFFAAVLPFLWVTGEWRRWREFRIGTGLLLFLAIAAPWHILAGIRNPDQGHPHGNIPTHGNVHGFFYFYFVNEHFLRFLGRRYPHDYNKQPWWVFWSGQLAWLFPWSLFFPLALRRAWRTRRSWVGGLRKGSSARPAHRAGAAAAFRERTVWLLSLYAAFILVFFAISTNQEYYTFPAYFPLLVLTTGILSAYERRAEAARFAVRETTSRWLMGAHGVFAGIGTAAALALVYGLWVSRHLPFVPDVGVLLAHRAVGNYSLSMSHLFDLTGPSFAALRLPAVTAGVALLLGPLAAWKLRREQHHVEATVSVAFTAAIFLIAAHIAFVRFTPMLSSREMARTINHVSGFVGDDPAAAARATFIIYGDQSDASSVEFYTQRQALLVHGRSTSMLWGSCYPDAPHIFLTDPELLGMWGAGGRKFLFAQDENRDRVEALLGKRAIVVEELADKTLYTDRPL
jgi:4-amino-4-deoxy-L-arabinose transferase-like glycosyltransferase